jgi:hypothetical protein
VSKKSRKLIRSGTAAASTPTPATASKPAEGEPEIVVDRNFFFLPEAPALAVEESDLHRLMKLWRHGRATRTIGQVLSDSYVVLFTTVLISAMVISAVINAQRGSGGCVTDACDTGRLLVPTAVVFAAFALAVSLARLFGPVLASAAEGFWLMDAPISRRRLLRGRLVAPLLVAVLLPAVVTGLTGALAGMEWFSVLAWSLAAGLGSAALVALAASEQTRERTLVLKGLQVLWTTAALAVGLVVIAIAAGWLPPATVGSTTALRWLVFGVAAVSLLAVLVFVVVAQRRLERIRRARLLSGGSLIAGMQGAMFALDFGLIRDILVERRAAEKGHVKPTKGHGLGINALIWRDAERLLRNPAPLLGLVMSILVPYATDALGLSQLNPLVSGLALTAALVPFLGSLRVLTRSGGLARSMPFKTTELRTALMAVPASLAALWAIAATPAFIGITSAGADRSFTDGLTSAVITGVAGLFGAVRWVSAKQPDFAAPMMATASGAMPPTLIFNLFRGFDMVALVTAPLILGADPLWSVALAVLVFIGLRGTFNMDELKAQQELAQREMSAAKADRSQKTKIAPPKR